MKQNGRQGDSVKILQDGGNLNSIHVNSQTKPNRKG